MPDAAPTTDEILALRGLGLPADRRCVDWAVALLLAGSDTPWLRVLAGEAAPFDVETNALVDRVLSELGRVPFASRMDAARALATALSRRIVEDDTPRTMDAALRELAQLHLELDAAPEFADFYLLECARSALREDEVQWYVDGAERGNIDARVRERCERWLAENADSSG